MTRSWISWLAAATLAGCIPIPISESAEGTLEAQVDVTGPCEGTGEQGDTTYTKSVETIEGVETCVIDVSWAGDIVDLSGVRQRIESEVGVDLSTIQATVTELTVEITGLRLVDASGNAVSAPSATFDTDFDIAGVDALDLTGASLDALLTSPVPVDVSDALIDAVQTALNEGGMIEGANASVLRIPTADLPGLQGVPNPLDIEIDVRADVSGQVSAGLGG